MPAGAQSIDGLFVLTTDSEGARMRSVRTHVGYEI